MNRYLLRSSGEGGEELFAWTFFDTSFGKSECNCFAMYVFFRYYPEKPSHLSPLDYVKNRIVEVMRTSEDKEEEKSGGGGATSTGSKERSDSPGDMVIDESKQQDNEINKLVVFNPSNAATSASSPFVPPTSSTYAYPFSALSVHAMSAANARSPTPSKPVVTNSSVTSKDDGGSQRNSEPAPLLSAQYEPLSDED